MFPRLRLAAAAVCFALAITLAALMVRSYWLFDMCSYIPQAVNQKYAVWYASSFGGFIRFSYGEEFDHVYAVGWTARALIPTAVAYKGYEVGQTSFPLEAQVQRSGSNLELYVGIAHWILATFLGALGLIFAKGRAAFSLRAALIATAVFALLLGLHVSLQRAFRMGPALAAISALP